METKFAGTVGAGRGGRTASLDPVISTILRYGVLASAFVILIGVALFVMQGGARAVLFSPHVIPPGVEQDPRSLKVVLDQLSPRQPANITDLGLLLLIATPVLSVLVSAVAFAVERDWMYLGIATFVLAMLAIGFALGRA